jgi:pyridoxal phosphate enzyme (YggS family)
MIMSAISRNLQAVHDYIATAALSASRKPNAVSLLAVSKTCSSDAVLEAARAGQRAFGENYEQEALAKIAAVRAAQPDLELEWHFIGPIQSNKTRGIAEHFDWVHSLDREKIARRLSDQRSSDLPPLNVCLQVNISQEDSKSGVSPEKVAELAHAVAAMPHLRLRGLMAIPEPEGEPDKQREPFRKMKQLFDELRAQGLELDTLSMGMTDDMNAAISEGATMVRVGTAIFGQRKEYEK